jgi:hypothetical protein
LEEDIQRPRALNSKHEKFVVDFPSGVAIIHGKVRSLGLRC